MIRLHNGPPPEVTVEVHPATPEELAATGTLRRAAKSCTWNCARNCWQNTLTSTSH